VIATLRLEVIGDNYRALDRAPLKRQLHEVRRHPQHASRLLDPGMKPWVAQITGRDSRHGLARLFLRGMRDYRDANKIGSRGVFLTFVLYPGHIYEVNALLSWSRMKRYFCRVESGAIVEMTTDEMARHLDNGNSKIQDIINQMRGEKT